MTLLEAYNTAIARADITDDAAQRAVIVDLQRVADALALPPNRWYTFGRKKTVNGLYLHGPVGVGKTYLVDLFYQTIPDTHKARFHFHHFMQQIDAQLRRLQGQRDPLLRIAADLSKSTRLLCLDEFLVHDVADAMILSELLQALFAHDIVLVATANTQPDDLYLKGVQRARFLPAIALIKQHCQVLQLTNDHDYRLGRSPLGHAYLCPLDEAAQTSLMAQFDAIAKGPVEGMELSVQHRLIPCVKFRGRTAWFTFDVICNMPRCQLDYLEIADRFDTVFVSDIPQLSEKDSVRAILFIHFIDVMYDRGIRLIISAAVPASLLYVAGPMQTSFKRTLSRLEEMHSADYLQRHEHRDVSNFD